MHCPFTLRRTIATILFALWFAVFLMPSVLLLVPSRVYADDLSSAAPVGQEYGPIWAPGGIPAASSFVPRTTLVVLLAGGIVSAIAYEEENPQAASRALDKTRFNAFLDIGDPYGDGRVLGAVTVSLFVVGRVTGNQRTSALATDLTRSLVTTSAVAWGVKASVNRTRPSGGNYSFPSGHTAAAFAIAPVLHEHFGWKAGAPAYALGAVTGISRMEENRHYLSDVVFGAAIGIAMGYWSTGGRSPFKFFDHLTVDSDGVGISTDF